jgi:hypothetical protein
MKATFVELPPFERHRSRYLDDEGLRALQEAMLVNPERGPVIQGTGGLRKLRFVDARRGKGKRGGLRVIYFWWQARQQFWLFTLYDKDQQDELTPKQRATLKVLLDSEITKRENS